ncbi:Tyrosine-protein kinase ITK/TSK [Nibea albiflora]|uniref:Tyrosine-protein kinase ITK/TSK n=1 Tax=Nibea albiflora TaxID=240163 RepID=A0ACB7EQ81_NIBAL|nr:Tyrosine-protein kinase ITK/TSK [Nibea albiflora]
MFSQKKPMVKGCIELYKIKCVEIVCSDVPIPCNYKYPFQVFHDNHYLYIFAPDNDCRQRWMIQQVSGQRIVIALQDYTPLGDDDLPLQKDQEYTLINGSHADWWAGKEGAFMVRDSRQAGVYTVSVFTKAPGSNGEKNPRVKHYQIRQTETGEATYYLAEKYLFSTIPELIHYHQHNAAGLITRLRRPVSQDGGCSLDIADPSKGQWEVDPGELTLGQEIGSGQFGLVLEGRLNESKVAVKMIREECMSDEEFKEEAKIMMRLSHCKLVQLYGVCTQRSPMCLVFEFMENGCLSDHLRARKGRLSQDVMLGMCLDVSEGMAYLESSNFIHRDLAARNCLVSKNNEVKVSDFGMTRFVLDDQYTSSLCSKFPVKWSAPEVIKYCKFSSKSDVCNPQEVNTVRTIIEFKQAVTCHGQDSLFRSCDFVVSLQTDGVLMWEVYNEGRLPYENRSNAEVVESLNSGLRLLKPRLAPDSVHLLMEWCWKEVGPGF